MTTVGPCSPPEPKPLNAPPSQRRLAACTERHQSWAAAVYLVVTAAATEPPAPEPNPVAIAWQPVGAYDIALTETMVARFRR